MDNMVQKNTINDLLFENDFYQKYISDIKLSSKYQELEKIVSKKDNLQILFSYCKDESKKKIQYEVGFEICDKNGNLISVPKDSIYWDRLYNLLSFFPVLSYQKTTQKLLLFDIDQAELNEDCQLFIEFIETYHS